MSGFKEICGIAGMTVSCFLLSVCMAGAGEDSFEGMMKSLKQVDAALMHYEQVKTVEVKMESPQALAVDGDGRIYVGGLSMLKIWDRDLENVQERNMKQAVTALAVGEDGTIFAGRKGYVEVLPKEGEPYSWADLGEKTQITSIALAGGRVFVADAGQRVLWKFSKEGRLEGMLGGPGSFAGRRGFILPSANFDAAGGPDGNLWVVNPGMHTLINISADGEKIDSWRKPGTGIEGFCGCCNPSHIAVLKDGSIVTGEKGLMRVKVMSPKGELVSVVADPNLFEKDDPHARLAAGAMPGRSEAVADLAVRGEQILVLDRNAGMIRIFEKKAAK